MALVTGKAPIETIVRVSGLSGAELRALKDARLDEPAWQTLMRVTVSDNDVAPVTGQFLVTDDAVEFHPRFPFDRGRSYSVRFDPGRLPVPRSEAALDVRLRAGGPEPSPPTSVMAIYPSATVWPENMLRLYVDFSGPMSRGAGTKYIHLVDDDGREVPDAILAAYADLWNPDATRLTVFFDPGRVKRGVGPNVAMGRAIVRGRRYAIAVDQAWPDAHGRPLSAGFRREFTAGRGGLRRPLDRATGASTRRRPTAARPWSWHSRRPSIARSSSARSACGRPMAATSRAASPSRPRKRAWSSLRRRLAARPLRVVAMTALEDPAGNKIGRAFEVLMADTPRRATDPEVVHVSFEIR